eukprot:Transcript_10225.p1 GENE.Transcript_10225~~Transcript_10225.p1  ORF type:complete len:271 (+),score=85.06 Transcript_10225:96-908(+)
MQLQSLFVPLILTASAVSLAALLTGLAFARSACRRVFNREPPPSSLLLPMLQVVRPFGMLWRLLTAPLRCLPDVYVLGEVRCGTTTVASLLRDELGMAGPFTPWVHPLANEKESFFLVGHYWGFVPLWAYRMCFPLRLSRWCHRVLLQRPFAVFEGCASYLSAPWAPALVRALTPRAVLVVCVREPVAQNVSWWRLEQGGMAWGSAMGLGERWCGPPARAHYPPRSLRAALALSRSAAVQAQWRDAEALPEGGGGPLASLPDWAALSRLV